MYKDKNVYSILTVLSFYISIFLSIYICYMLYMFYIYIYIYIYIHIYIYIYTGEMKSQFFIGMLLWVSCHCIHQEHYLLYVFCLPEINKSGNTKVCSAIPLSRKMQHIENSQSICKKSGKRNFRVNYRTHAKYKIQFS